MKLVDKYKLENRVSYIVNEANESNYNIFSDDIEDVKLAVESGEDINQINDEGLTPLTNAISSDNYEIVEYLINNNAVINGSARNKPDLFLAIKNNNARIASILIENGADVEEEWNGFTTLGYAIKTGFLDQQFFILLIPTTFKSSSSFIKCISTMIDNLSIIDTYYRAMYNKIIENSNIDFVSDFAATLAGHAIECEASILEEDLPTLSLLSEYKLLPVIEFTDIPEDYFQDINIINYSREAILKNYKLPSNKANGYTMSDYIETVIAMCAAIGEFSFAYIVASPEVVDELNKLPSKEPIVSLTYQCAKGNKLSVLEYIKDTVSIPKEYVYLLFNALIYDLSEEATLLVTSMILEVKNPSVDIRYINDLLSEVNINSNTDLIGDFLIALGYESYIANYKKLSKSMSAYKKQNKLSKNKSGSSALPDYYEFIAKVIASIERDVLTSSLRNYINNHKDILLDDKVAEAIKYNLSTSITARQLNTLAINYKNSHPESISKYDF